MSQGPIVLAFSGGLDTSFCVPWLRGAPRPRGGHRHRRHRRPRRAPRAAALAERLARSRRARAPAGRRAGAPSSTACCASWSAATCGAAASTRSASAPSARCRRGRWRAPRASSAHAVAHGSTAAGNDQVRFEVALRTLAPELEILAPVRDESRSRAEEVAYLERRGLPVPPHGAAYSVNRGLWGTTIGGTRDADQRRAAARGRLGPHPRRLRRSRARPSATGWPSSAACRPPRRRGARPGRADRAARARPRRPFGIGRGIHLGDTILGLKGRVAFEAPAAEVLLTAHRELEKLVLTGRQQRLKETVAAVYGDLVHEGQHLEPACRDLEALLASSQARVTGEVALLLGPGALFVEGVSSPFSLLAASRGVYGEATGEWTAADAARLLAARWRCPPMLHARARRGRRRSEDRRPRQDRLGHPQLRALSARCAWAPRSPARRGWWSRCACCNDKTHLQPARAAVGPHGAGQARRRRRRRARPPQGALRLLRPPARAR